MRLLQVAILAEAALPIVPMSLRKAVVTNKLQIEANTSGIQMHRTYFTCTVRLPCSGIAKIYMLTKTILQSNYYDTITLSMF